MLSAPNNAQMLYSLTRVLLVVSTLAGVMAQDKALFVVTGGGCSNTALQVIETLCARAG